MPWVNRDIWVVFLNKHGNTSVEDFECSGHAFSGHTKKNPEESFQNHQ
jgi:hypothetical protein